MVRFLSRPLGPLLSLLRVLALLGATPLFSAQPTLTEAPAPVPLTAEQKSAIAALDVRLRGVEALIQKVNDPKYRAELDGAIKDFHQRRDAMAKNFDQGLYDNLMHAIISRYQIVALWLKPPLVPSADGKKADAKAAPTASH